ncbi:hypothetical protein [Butyrivibrio fibrisolvens]|uniref:hypothetical protein n=1 Tax=Butyrivibrio fibrisolvens TaxID=831 RepID=UPI0003B38D06|nr:hypothetical protein [Butyrivibrio fibrisolvens]
MKKLSYTTTTYEYKDGYCVDIVYTGEFYQSYVYHKDNCEIKSLMLGISNVDYDWMLNHTTEFMDEYIERYEEEMKENINDLPIIFWKRD